MSERKDPNSKKVYATQHDMTLSATVDNLLQKTGTEKVDG